MSEAMEFRVRKLCTLLGGFRYMFSSEIQLHEAMADVLRHAGEEVEREKVLDARNRADITLAGGVLIEVKVDGSLSHALRQCDRYSALSGISAVILASTVGWARRPLVTRPRMGGKPFGLVYLPRQAL